MIGVAVAVVCKKNSPQGISKQLKSQDENKSIKIHKTFEILGKFSFSISRKIRKRTPQALSDCIHMSVGTTTNKCKGNTKRQDSVIVLDREVIHAKTSVTVAPGRGRDGDH